MMPHRRRLAWALLAVVVVYLSGEVNAYECTHRAQSGSTPPRCSNVTSLNSADRAGLLSFYASTKGEDWLVSNWSDSPESNFCGWTGVRCHPVTCRVVQLDFEANNLYGSISEDLELLDALEQLVLPCNQLAGTIPSTLANMQSLSSIILAANGFHGSIPSLENWPELVSIDLSENWLNGSVSRNLTLAQLAVLNLSGNRRDGDPFGGFYGELPELSGLPSLLQFRVGGNKFSGPLFSTPAESLEILDVSDNFLENRLPSSWSVWPRLRSLDLSFNFFHGHLPDWSSEQFPSLEELYVNHNELSGHISHFNISTLRVVDFSDNDFRGHLPNLLQHSEHLQFALFRNNGFTGEVRPLSTSVSIVDIQGNSAMSCVSPGDPVADHNDPCDFKDNEFFRASSSHVVKYARATCPFIDCTRSNCTVIVDPKYYHFGYCKPLR